MKLYFAYVRVSTVRQGEQGTSPQEQRHAITGYALSHGLEITAWYQESETAAKRGRPEFNRMLRDLRRARAAGVIIHKIDRSARNLRDWADLLELVDKGVELHFAHDTVDLTSRGGRLTANIQAIMAADYSRNLSDEVRKGQLGRLRQGLWPLRAPKGYRDMGKGKAKEIDPVDGPLVREAFELYATRRYDIETLRIEMARRGLHQSRGNPLSASHMGYILHNPFYIGLMRFSTIPELFQGKHLPLIEPALYDRVQQIMAGKAAAKVQTHDFTFRRRIRCAGCGRSLTGEIVKGHTYYRCHTRTCRKVVATPAAINAAVCEKLSYFSLTPKEVGDFRNVLREHIDAARGTERAQVKQVKLDIAKLDERSSVLTDALLDGTIDRETYAAKKNELLARRAVLVQLVEHPEANSFWSDTVRMFEQGFVALPRYLSAIADEMRDVVDTLGSNLIVQANEPVFTLVSTLELWVNWSKMHGMLAPSGQSSNKEHFRRFLDTLKHTHDAVEHDEHTALPSR